LEDLLVAAQAVGVEACYIYLQDSDLQRALVVRRELINFMPIRHYPPLPLIELRRGAGENYTYICGRSPP
jgi:formate dehydrogenase